MLCPTRSSLQQGHGPPCFQSHNSCDQCIVLPVRRCHQFSCGVCDREESFSSHAAKRSFSVLSFSDFLVGLVVQPCYVVFRLFENIKHFVPCGLRIVYSESFWVCYGVSFLTLSAISFERYTALRLHLRYKQLVTSERVLKVAIGIWLSDIFLTFMEWAAQTKHLRNIHAGLLLFCLVVTLTAHIKIFWILRHHQRQINSFNINRSRQVQRNMQRQSRLAVSAAYVVVIYITCSFPVLIAMAYLFAGGHFANFNVFSWTETIAFLNSLINPIFVAGETGEFAER